MSAREVTLTNHHPRLRLSRRGVLRVIHLLDAEFYPPKIENRKSKIFSMPVGELSVVFLTDPALAQLHAAFLADPSITDVITFEGDPAHGVAGEICISADAALRHVSPRRAPALSTPLSAFRTAAFSRELTLYLIHGWLHLVGYDDLQPAKKRVMRRAEARAMNILCSRDAIPAFTVSAAR